MQYGKVSMTMKRIKHITKQDEAKHDKKPQELDEGQVDILPNWDMLHLGCYTFALPIPINQTPKLTEILCLQMLCLPCAFLSFSLSLHF